MRLAIIGTGYVGLVHGTIMSSQGHKVICVDLNEDKIEKLKKGEIPIYEPELESILKVSLKKGSIEFITNLKVAVEKSEVIFIAVGTPPLENGEADLSYVLKCSKEIAEYMNGYKVIVTKSTVPVGTGDLITEEIKKINKNLDFDVVSNPEFLREGNAVNDSLNPDRVIIGVENERSRKIMENIYSCYKIKGIPMIFTNRRTSEMIKYASNAFLAVKISYINELALLAEKVGANIEKIAEGMGLDKRISPKFLECGPGYGGSCFPKDTNALVKIGNSVGEEMNVIKAAILANDLQKEKLVKKIVEKMEGVDRKVVSVLGLSFKPETDDTREAPSIEIIKKLYKKGAKIKTYCPKGIPEAKLRLNGIDIEYSKNEEDCCKDSDAIILVTEWNQFKNLNLSKIKKNMKDNFFFDLRNVYSKNSKIRGEFKYYPIGQE